MKDTVNINIIDAVRYTWHLEDVKKAEKFNKEVKPINDKIISEKGIVMNTYVKRPL